MPSHGAIVAVAPVKWESSARASARRGVRANADFIAHLVATAGRAPQTRARRRAEPETAVAAYRASSRSPDMPGNMVCRTL